VHRERAYHVLDCSHVGTPEELWSLYLERVDPNDGDRFGRNLDGLWDALAAGGPGSPGPCFFELRNVEPLESRHPSFVLALEAIGRELRDANADVELSVIRFAGAPRGRLYQHQSFITRELEGMTVEQLLSWSPREGECDMLWLKPAERPWQRFVLEAGLTFWDEYEEDVAFEDFEDVRHDIADVATDLGLAGQEVGLVRAHSDREGWWLEIAFRSGGRLRLEAAEPSSFASPIRLRYCEAT
jgi:hypothetical protein